MIDHGWHYEFDVLFPEFWTNGTYRLSGQLLLLKLDGRGSSSGKYEDVTAHCKVLQDHRRNADGSHTPRIKSIQLRTKVKKGKLQLDNLFGGNKELSDTLNAAINQNFEAFSGELLPMMDKKFASLMKNYTNKLFAHFTSEQLYPGVDFEKKPSTM